MDIDIRLTSSTDTNTRGIIEQIHLALVIYFRQVVSELKIIKWLYNGCM